MATASENTIVTVAVSPLLSAVSSIVNELTVGAVVSTTNAEPAAKFVAGVKFVIALPAASLNDPAVNSIEDAVRSADV